MIHVVWRSQKVRHSSFNGWGHSAWRNICRSCHCKWSPESIGVPRRRVSVTETVRNRVFTLLMTLNYTLTCYKRIFRVVLGKVDWNILKHINKGLCLFQCSLLFSKGNSEGKNAVQDSSRQSAAVFTKNKQTKNGSCHFGNQAVLNLKESYICFCMCIYMIHMLLTEQRLL